MGSGRKEIVGRRRAGGRVIYAIMEAVMVRIAERSHGGIIGGMCDVAMRLRVQYEGVGSNLCPFKPSLIRKISQYFLAKLC